MPSAIVVELGIAPEQSYRRSVGSISGTTWRNGHDHVFRPISAAPALIVEDEIMIALALEAEVKDLGFDVCGLAANANQAISMAMEGEPDLAVMDIYLNGARDGIETARVLRDLCGVQVVFVTAYSDDEGLAERIQQQVPNAPVLTKPLYGHRLADAIAKASEVSTSPAM
jgi:response regulator of citrate/malate metabolism